MSRKKMTRITWIAIPVALVAILIYTQRIQRQTQCPEMVVEIENKLPGSFLTPQQVLNHLHQLNDTLTGKNIHDIDLTRVRKQVMSLPYVADADAFFAMNGVMKIRVTQRTPITKVYDRSRTSIYIANDGLIMPVHAGEDILLPLITSDIHDSLVRFAGKNIYQTNQLSILREAFKVTAYIRSDSLLKALVPHIHITHNKEIELFPAIDDHVVIFGNSDSLEYKFRKLITFYRKGMVRTGWDTYQSISLKYGNQVIGTREP